MKILIVEDEPKIAASIRQGLTENGFVVEVAGRGDNGLHLARTGGSTSQTIPAGGLGRPSCPRQ